MRRFFFATALGLLLMGCVLTVPRPAAVPTPTVSPPLTPTPVDWADLNPYRRAMRPAFASDVDLYEQATRYAIDLTVDIEALTLRGVQRVRVTSAEAEPLSEIVFRLLPNTPGYGGSMAVRSVTVEGLRVEPDLRLDGSAVYVPLAAPLRPGETTELNLVFEGTIPTDPSAGYAQYGYIDGVLALPNAYPMIPVYDDEGWNVELAPTYGDAAFTDTSLYLVRVTLPARMISAASGVEVDRQDNGDGTATVTYASGPMRDFALVASEAYRTVTHAVGEVLVTSYFFSGDEEGGELVLDYASRALEVYEETFGTYPFTELDVVETPTLAGGIEYPGLIVVAASLYGERGGFFELATVHEVAHQWWYSLVGNDQLDEPWLDESLTQYASLFYFEDRYGPQSAQRVLENTFEVPYRYIQEREQDMAVGLPVASYTEDLYGAVVYGKGPLFFHAVRQQVGDEAFFEILRTYYDEYRYGVAYPADWMAVAERVSGQELDALYAHWILGE